MFAMAACVSADGGAMAPPGVRNAQPAQLEAALLGKGRKILVRPWFLTRLKNQSNDRSAVQTRQSDHEIFAELSRKKKKEMEECLEKLANYFLQ